MKWIYYTFLVILYGLGFGLCAVSCVSSPSSKHSNPVYCEINAEWNRNNNEIKSRVRFYIQDSSSVRPYFLTSPVYWNADTMAKKHHQNRGVFYTFKGQMPSNNTTLLSFSKLDDKQQDISFHFPEKDVKKWKEEERLENILQEKKQNTKIVLIDAQKKMWVLEKDLDKNKINFGKSIVLEVFKQDTIFQIQDNLWCKYQLKTLSKGQEILIRKD